MQVKVNGYNINYEVLGSGYPVVLVHGWLTDIESMRPIAEGLKDSFQVYLVDVIGFGKSDLPKEPLNSNKFGEFLRDFLKAVKIKNPVLIGHSNGGRTIINAVGRRIVQPKKIVLIDSAGLIPKRSMKYHIKVKIAKTGKKVLSLMPNNKKMQEFTARLQKRMGSSDYNASPEVLKQTMKHILNEDVTELLPKINVPTLLIWGGLDVDTPIEQGRKMEKLIPDAGLVEYPYGSHFAYLENIQNVNVVLNEFLKDLK